MIDYPAHLEMMWQRAIAPREPNAPKVISTFAGGGGSLTGYMMAGYDDILAVEWDDNAVETLRLNWPDLDIYHGDIAKLTVEEVLKRTGLAVGELDLLDGSPPCQGFSTAGKRMMDDPRNQLFREYVRLLRGVQPKVFVMENVSGMVKGKMKLVFVEILKELKASGYKVKACLLNAKYFHVPQSRERMIFIGVRDDLGAEPSHPAGESGGIIVKDALRNSGHVDSPALSALYQQYWLAAPVGGVVGKLTQARKLNPNQVAATLVKSEGNGAPYHHVECRAISTNERKRLASFPDIYTFTSRESATERIGNSVPPLFMEAIARHIRKEILDKLA